MGWECIAPWKIIPGTGQSLSLTSGDNQHFANAVGKQTRAIAVSLAPLAAASATGYALVTVSPPNGGTGTAATASTDYMVKTSDPPQIIGCGPGDIVNVYAAANGTAFLVELTH